MNTSTCSCHLHLRFNTVSQEHFKLLFFLSADIGCGFGGGLDDTPYFLFWWLIQLCLNYLSITIANSVIF